MFIAPGIRGVKAAFVLVELLITLSASGSSVGGSGVSNSVIGVLPPTFYSATSSYIYVAPYGQDNSSCGSITLPCQSISYVDQNLLVNNASTTQVVLLRGGIYYLSSPFAPSKNGGSASSPIVYAAYPGETPILTGAQPITGWTTPCTAAAYVGLPNCWQAPIPTTVTFNFDYLLYVPAGWPSSSMLSVIGRRSQSTNTPSTYNRNACATDTRPTGCSNSPWSNKVLVNNSDIAGVGIGSSGFYSEEDVKYYNFSQWNVDALRVDGFAPGPPLTSTTELEFTNNATGSNLIGYFIINGVDNRYLIINSREFFINNNLPVPGTFYLDCGGTTACVNNVPSTATIYYIAKTGETPSSDLILAPQVSQLIVDSTGNAGTSGTNFLIFQGLAFLGDNFTTTSTGYPSQSGQPAISAALSFVNTTGIVIDSSIIAHTSGWGLEFTNTPCDTANCVLDQSKSNTLSNSALYDIGASGLRIGRYPPCSLDPSCGNNTDQGNSLPVATNSTTVKNDIFYGIGRIYPNGEGGCIWIGSANTNTIENNECGDSYGGGIEVGPNVQITSDFEFNNQIKYNYIHDIGEGVISDFGCVHFATLGGSTSSPGDTFQYNICRDITHNSGDSANGGTGIYIDNNSQNVTVRDNLVFRTSGPLFFNNISPSCTQSGSTSCNNSVQSNIFAYSLQGPIKRGGNSTFHPPVGDALRDFTFQNNIVYFGVNQETSSGPQWLGGSANADFWDCGLSNTSTGTTPPCTLWFQFLSNAYYSPSLTFNLPTFVTVNITGLPLTRSVQYWYGLPQWQTQISSFPNEDETSGGTATAVYAYPGFVDPSYASNNFQFQSTTVPNTIGFDLTDFNMYTYGAGRSTPLLFPSNVMPSFPLQLVSPAQF